MTTAVFPIYFSLYKSSFFQYIVQHCIEYILERNNPLVLAQLLCVMLGPSIWPARESPSQQLLRPRLWSLEPAVVSLDSQNDQDKKPIFPH